MNITLDMKDGRVRFSSKFKTVLHKLICVKNNVYPATIKNDNGAVAMSFLCNANGTKNPIKLRMAV